MTDCGLAILAALCVASGACTTSATVLGDRDASPDASGVDSGSSDVDTGVVRDDAGGMDAATSDAGGDASRDTGVVGDDAGASDGGVDASPDAGTVTDDAAVDDGIVDGGADAHVDADTWHCDDGMRDGDETGSDCGASCAPCPDGTGCGADSDCISSACDAISLVCVASECADRRIDGAETDEDCGGGACPVCATGMHCRVDDDCTTFACDFDSHLCITDACADHRMDGHETDVDCGGGTCGNCPLGDMCAVPADCAPAACDLIMRRCISDECADHRVDGMESDVDCGGLVCANCGVGRHCNNNGDCQPGHVCSGFTTPHTCT